MVTTYNPHSNVPAFLECGANIECQMSEYLHKLSFKKTILCIWGIYSDTAISLYQNQTYCSCGTIPELSEAGVAGVMGVMGVRGVLYSGVFPGRAVVVEPVTVWEW